ncbi:hypothetical protein ECP03047993_5346 [Escherichia coli P0304799.3]|nr:hypothetical protein ECP03047993_5346 [Escherichia coli P0304799.3]
MIFAQWNNVRQNRITVREVFIKKEKVISIIINKDVIFRMHLQKQY